MTRLVVVAVLVTACADDARIARLEKRMDNVERAQKFNGDMDAAVLKVNGDTIEQLRVAKILDESGSAAAVTNWWCTDDEQAMCSRTETDCNGFRERMTAKGSKMGPCLGRRTAYCAGLCFGTLKACEGMNDFLRENTKTVQDSCVGVE